MTKVETIDALMESAIQNFSQHGYVGASLRDIAAGADVPLSTIHMYFGSKSDLYAAATQKVWVEINNERSALLQAALLNNPGRAPPLGDLIYALALPVVRRALSKSDHDRARIVLIRTGMSDQPHIHVNRVEVIDRSITRWIDGMTHTCPTLARQDVIWAYSFIVGAIYSWQLIDHRYDKLLGSDIERTAEAVAGDIVAFGCAGVQAMIDRRSAAPGVKM